MSKSVNLVVPEKTQATRMGSPGLAARLRDRNPGAFDELKVKPITGVSIENKYFVPQKYLKPSQILLKEQLLNGNYQPAQSFGQ